MAARQGPKVTTDTWEAARGESVAGREGGLESGWSPNLTFDTQQPWGGSGCIPETPSPLPHKME